MPKNKSQGHDMKLQRIKSPTGVVKKFDRETLVGVVSLGRSEFTFLSTSFQSNSSLRFPRIGETVEVVTNTSGALLSLHGK